MNMLSKRHITTLLGSILALILLVITFYRVDLHGLKAQLAAMSFPTLAAMIALSLAGLFFRGVRWWLLLARPVEKREFWAIQRALAISYAVGNVISRLAEVVRIAVAKSETERDVGALTGTVVLDRLLFDGMTFGLMLGSALLWNRNLLISLLPGSLAFVWAFGSILLLGCAGLLCLAFKPHWIQRTCDIFRLFQIPFFGPLLLKAIEQISGGLKVLTQPKYLIAAACCNGIVWLLPYLYFILVLAAFEVDVTLGQAWFIFSLTVVGVLIPSPGGLGSYHLMVTLGLTHLLHVSDEKAAAIALLTHGVNYLMLFIAGLSSWLLSRRSQKQANQENELVR